MPAFLHARVTSGIRSSGGMRMRLVAFGGDARMLGVLSAARRAGWETGYICRAADAPEKKGNADAVMLPWPHSFREGKLEGTEIAKEEALGMLPACRIMLHGAGTEAKELTMAQAAVNPSLDEVFLRDNARLTAEGALARAMGRQGKALLDASCMVTGFGRIGQELVIRLVAMDAFVIVCARNDMQMRRAHELGAHPVHIDQIASACRQADVIFNTIPAHVLGKRALDRIRPDALVIELASPPYGMNIELARHMGVDVALESGLPGRYAPMSAGAALFAALERAMKREEGGESHG